MGQQIYSRNTVASLENRAVNTESKRHSNPREDIIMLKAILVLLVFAIAGVAYGGTDEKCVNDCAKQGYQIPFCRSQCSYDHQKQPYQPQWPQVVPSPLPGQQPLKVTPIPKTDQKCLSDCTSKGYLYPLCKERCSY